MGFFFGFTCEFKRVYDDRDLEGFMMIYRIFCRNLCCFFKGFMMMYVNLKGFKGICDDLKEPLRTFWNS